VCGVDVLRIVISNQVKINNIISFVQDVIVLLPPWFHNVLVPYSKKDNLDVLIYFVFCEVGQSWPKSPVY
jgi:hypothetical protein